MRSLKQGSKAMNNMPKNLRAELTCDPYYYRCVRGNSECEGRITFEHALMYRGKQIQERFAIIPLCEYHHLGEGLIKRYNQAIALARATEKEKEKYPLLPWGIYEVSKQSVC